MATFPSSRAAACMARPALFFLTLLAAFALMGFSPRQAGAAIFFVSPSGAGDGTTWAKAGPLQTVINAAHPGDQVWAKYGAYTGNFTTTDGVAVYGHFVGTETNLNQRQLSRATYASILNGNNSGTVYTIPSAASGTNTLDGFTVQDGPSRGIYDPSGDNLVIANCTVANNSVGNADGAGVFANGTTVTITNCSFNNNVTTGAYQGNDVHGGGVYAASSTTATISNCFFTGNSATAGAYRSSYGGAIFTAGTATISGCTINSNNASSQGGGVYSNGSAITIQSNCTFTSNTNGGVYAGASSNTISDSAFTSNTGRGVAVFGPNSSTISGCTFTGNSVGNANGGGLYTSSLMTIITGCTFNNNNTTGSYQGNNVYGGGLYFESGTTAAISNCTFTGNSATAGAYRTSTGGGASGYGTPYITNCTFTSNSPDEINLEDVGTNSSPALIADNLIYGSGTGGGNGIDLAINGGSTTFAYVMVANNTIIDANAGINVGTGSNTGGEVAVANNIFYANNGGVNFNAGATFVSSHNDLFSNSYNYNGVALNASDLTVDPKFIRNPNFSASPPDLGDLHLMSTSPLVNAGDNTYVYSGDTDRDGNPRIQGSAVDIGCFETPSNSAARLSSLSPATVQAGHNSFTLTVNGTGFQNGAVVDWNGMALTTRVLSVTQLSATVPASLVASVGTAGVSVVNPNMGASTSLTFTITAAATITSLSPASKPADGPAFSLTVPGTGYLPGAVVLWNGAALPTTVNSSTQLTATVPASYLATPGTVVITAANPNSSATNPLTFTITTPIATLTSLAPATVQAGGPAFTLTITGAHFVPGAVVQWNGVALASGYFNSIMVVAQVPASDLAAAGTAQVTVVNPGAAVSNALAFTVTPIPAPAQLVSLSPATVQAGSGTFTLVVKAMGLAPGAVVQWNGTALPSAYLTVGIIAAQVPASDVAAAGTAQITVVNFGAAASNALTFTVTPIPAPAQLTSLSPATAVAGSPTLTLIVNGTGFVSGAVVLWNGAALPSAYLTSGVMAAQIPASDLAAAGTAQITVVNLGAAASNALPFTVTIPAPTITSFTPTSGPGGTSVTITGTNFTGASSVKFNTSATTFTLNSATQITATVPAGTTTGKISVTTPGGTATSSGTFTVTP